MGESFAFRGDDHSNSIWTGQSQRGRREVQPSQISTYSDLRLPRPQNGRDRNILGQVVSHLLPNMDDFPYTFDISKSAIMSLCVTLCHLLTPILVIKVTVWAGIP